jgi:hypothetical protein
MAEVAIHVLPESRSRGNQSWVPSNVFNLGGSVRALNILSSLLEVSKKPESEGKKVTVHINKRLRENQFSGPGARNCLQFKKIKSGTFAGKNHVYFSPEGFRFPDLGTLQ